MRYRCQDIDSLGVLVSGLSSVSAYPAPAPANPYAQALADAQTSRQAQQATLTGPQAGVNNLASNPQGAAQTGGQLAIASGPPPSALQGATPDSRPLLAGGSPDQNNQATQAGGSGGSTPTVPTYGATAVTAVNGLGGGLDLLA